MKKKEDPLDVFAAVCVCIAGFIGLITIIGAQQVGLGAIQAGVELTNIGMPTRVILVVTGLVAQLLLLYIIVNVIIVLIAVILRHTSRKAFVAYLTAISKGKPRLFKEIRNMLGRELIEWNKKHPEPVA